VILRQVTHDDLGCASYLIGDGDAGVAAVVDPRFEIDEYLELARYFGVTIEHILETHNHADHVSGHGRLAAATGATIHIHRLADPGYEHEPFDDNWELELGSLTVRALHTPGHRPEHTAFALIDRARAEEPWAVLSGDSLFVNDVARPDLAIEQREGARDIFHSLQERLLTLPETCEVWPGHLGGSMCGGPGMDMKTSSTIGYERRHSASLAITDEGEFVEQAVAELGPQPPNFEAIVELNKGPLVTAGVEVAPLTPRQVELKHEQGALLVDARTDRQFDDGHIDGAVCVPSLGAGFGSKLAWLAGPDQEVVLIGVDDEHARDAARLAAAVGVTRVAGFIGGGMTGWHRDGRPVRELERLPLEQLEGRLADDGVQVLDVRERSEWDSGHIPDSVWEAWHEIDAIPEGVDPERPIAVICGSGERAAVGASLLTRFGAERVIHVVDGGVPKWGRLGHPLVKEDLNDDGSSP
jgi:glyoxylase-like metal-dependent hydrolase (beta-lactamase superfamily II)